jgi:hypothetical protein
LSSRADEKAVIAKKFVIPSEGEGPASLSSLRISATPPRYNFRMYTPQAGIFALGTSSHAYLEFDLHGAVKNEQFASTMASIREPRVPHSSLLLA